MWLKICLAEILTDGFDPLIDVLRRKIQNHGTVVRSQNQVDDLL